MIRRIKAFCLALVALLAIAEMAATAVESALLENLSSSDNVTIPLLLTGLSIALSVLRIRKSQQSHITVSTTNQVTTLTGTPHPQTLVQPIARLSISHHERKAQTFNPVMAC